VDPAGIVQAAIDAYHDHRLDRCLGFPIAEILVLT
jgi:hypothetical protein